jgi:uncharacterized membrane protein
MNARVDTWGGLAIALAAEGRIDATTVERIGQTPAGYAPPTPWYIVALLTAGAWIAASLFLFFFIAIKWVEDGPSFVALGVGYIAASVGLGYFTRSVFFQQLGIALGIAGQISLAVGIQQIGDRMDLTWACLTGVAILLFFLQPNGIHRFLTVFVGLFGTASWIDASNYERLYHVLLLGMAVAGVYGWERESALVARGRAPWMRPLVAGLTLAAPVVAYAMEQEPALLPRGVWISSAGLGLLFLYIVRRVAPLPALVFALLFLVFSFDRPGLIASLAFAMLAYDRGHRPIAVLLLAAFVANVGYIVYRLDIDWLYRSLLLAGGGAVLLAMYGVMRLTAPPPAEGEQP